MGGECHNLLALPSLIFFKPAKDKRKWESRAIRSGEMKIEIIETLNFPPETIFAVLTDIPHHVDWVVEPVELVSLSDGPARLGTKWEQNADRLGKKLVTLNTCNIYEKNKKFGWKSEKPFPAQVTLTLQPDQDLTKLTWTIESEETGIVQLAEPLLIKQTDQMIRKSLVQLKEYRLIIAYRNDEMEMPFLHNGTGIIV
jgi:polyketide cyclase/dehydrase/lipid transport protein